MNHMPCGICHLSSLMCLHFKTQQPAPIGPTKVRRSTNVFLPISHVFVEIEVDCMYVLACLWMENGRLSLILSTKVSWWKSSFQLSHLQLLECSMNERRQNKFPSLVPRDWLRTPPNSMDSRTNPLKKDRIESALQQMHYLPPWKKSFAASL